MTLTGFVHTIGVFGLIALAACGGDGSDTPTEPSPGGPPSGGGTAALTVTFGENPVPFRSSGCNASTPQGWFTTARIQETAGVTFTVTALTQKLNGSPAGQLSETFNSRFGACSGGTFTPGAIVASGAVCGDVGVCSTDSFSTYQFQLQGTDANGHPLTIDSPVLQLGAR